MMNNKKDAAIVMPYGQWQSAISIESIFAQPAPPMYPFRYDGVLFWVQALPEQGGRFALMTEHDDGVICLTPKGFSLRSRVHEYGGACFCVYGDSIIFNNFSDGRLYRQALVEGSEPAAITSAMEGIVGFADLVAVQALGGLVAVMERAIEGTENVNLIVGIALSGEIQELAVGSDFYASPVVNNTADKLAWFEWDHPYMPWDQGRLCIAELAAEDGQLLMNNARRIVDGAERSICQLGFLRDGSLVFVSDSEECNWWNFYRWDDGEIDQLTDEEMEFGEAHWAFGQCRWVQSGENALLAVATSHDGDRLMRVAIDGSKSPREILVAAQLAQLSKSEDSCLLICSPDDRAGGIVEVALNSDSIRSVGPEAAGAYDEGVSKAVGLSCDTVDGEKTWGYFYAPHNVNFAAPKDSLPPLVVMVHGGPTGKTNAVFNPLKQYFCSLGFAVLDINHRGSVGYGRKFRQRLLGQWGKVDAMDIASGIDYLIAEGKVDAEGVFIRGGSAGGYAVLRALTRYPEKFAGGACYYGIGNLITLCEITHKFESRYTDRLIGEAFDPVTAREVGSLYIERSPIFEMDRLSAPLIVFQGSEDKVVPPAVSQEVVDVLKQKGIKYGYTEYEGEGHGFRKAKNRVDSLTKETDFFIDVLNERRESKN